MNNYKFTTHARTLAELRDEFLTDLNRRMAVLDGQLKISRNAAESTRLAARQNELQSVLDFWTAVELRGEKRRSRQDQSAEAQDAK